MKSAYVSKNLTVNFDQTKVEPDPILTYKKSRGLKNFWKRFIQKIAPSPYIAFKRKLNAFAYEGYETLSVPFSPYNLEDHPLVRAADIVHLHWASELIDARFFKKLNKPVVWTLHDMNPFLGAFHYKTDKQLATEKLKVLDALFHSHKVRQYSAIQKLAVVSPSKWLMEAARESEVFPQAYFSNIANPISFDSDVERKDAFDSENSAIIIAHDLKVSRKGMHLLEEALNIFDFNLSLTTLGKGAVNCSNEKVMIDALGAHKTAEEIMESYSRADVLILPSLEDNLPNTMLEALSVGTPVIAFNTGGMKETIKPGFNGLLVPEMTAESLAETLDKFFKEKHQYNRNAIREDAKLQFEAASQAAKYLEVYKNLTP